MLATTDDPSDDLAEHAALAADPTWAGRVIPTFRPDRYLEPAQRGWPDAVAQLGKAADVATGDYAGYVRALETRRRYFIEHGAVSADHSHVDVRTDPLEPAEAARIYRSALAADASPAEATAFRRHMLLEMARMSCEDGLVMTLHPGVRRGHHGPTTSAFGPDTGNDLPLPIEFTDALRPLLERYGTHPGYHLVVFTLDETVFSRELAPLAGFYPALYLGVPWWFLDAPHAIRRFREAVTETAGFSRTSGFIDDTRAFCSIPARHACAAASTQAGSPSSLPSTSSTRTRRWRPRGTWSPSSRGRCSSYENRARVVPQPRRPVRRAGSPGPPRAGQLSSVRIRLGTPIGPPTLRPGHRRLHRPQHRPGRVLERQDGLYTLITRAADGDRFEVVSSLSATHPGADHDAWLSVASPHRDVHGVTLTVTEAAYVRAPDGGLDGERPEIRADVAALRDDLAAPVHTVPARLVAGCAARRRADAGPLALISCDNLPGNGAVLARWSATWPRWSTPALPSGWRRRSPASPPWSTGSPPEPPPRTVRTVAECTGREDCCPVATEPFSEWVLSGAFPSGRPGWGAAGATITEEIEPYQHRKLWLLNGAHSILAYAGSARGHQTVADAVADDTCRNWMQQWWNEASPHLDLPAAEIQTYREALLERFANPRMQHRLAQIAADGSQKLPVRILPVLRQERAAGRMPQGAARGLAAWVAHLRGAGAPLDDVRADQMLALANGPLPDAVRRVLDALDPALAADDELVKTVLADAGGFRQDPAGVERT